MESNTNDVKKRDVQKEITQSKIAKELGLTRAAVSLAEKTALKKLKKALRARHNIRKISDLL